MQAVFSTINMCLWETSVGNYCNPGLIEGLSGHDKDVSLLVAFEHCPPHPHLHGPAQLKSLPNGLLDFEHGLIDGLIRINFIDQCPAKIKT